MSCLSIHDLALFTGGHLRLGVLPPLGGALEPIRRIQTDLDSFEVGNIFWQCDPQASVHEAFARGAMGVVYEGTRVEPWAGRFSLQVRSTKRALQLAAMRSRRQFGGCLVALANLDWRGCQREAGREFVQCLSKYCQVGGHAEPNEENDMAREIIHLDEHRPFAVFNLYRQSAGVRRGCLERFGADVTVTTRRAAGELPPTNTSVVFADDFNSLAEVAWAASKAGNANVQPEPIEALPTMLDLRESDMPTLLGRSNQLADWWLLGRSPWRVLPGRA